jgi:hypothetical protein
MSVKSFFEKFETEFKDIFKATPTVAQRVQGFLPYVAAIAQTVIAIAAPADAPILNMVISKIQAATATAATVVQEGTPAPGSSALTALETALNSIKTNAASILSVASVKNSTTAATVTTDINDMVTDINLLLGALPMAAPPAA